MAIATDVISQLVRAANEVDKIQPDEFSGLIYRSIVVIRDLRESVGIPGSGTRSDAIVLLWALARSAPSRSRSELGEALLQAADMIRTLHIVADSGVAIDLKVMEHVD
ncbi:MULTISPECIES: hypothetical protein [unclassified Rhizobium]|uniref:hypothetical protein n=1 Tax=unclassified Rhizobium TaxID=2613769 RepID=UPI00161EC204|nr:MULTISPECIES: hypothetical protein [unclassified Rhizobium]MBB3320416.1 hypothetical protein [Rhizobium sp. BK181]MBB3543522.1 hypothetical protein [Rhizobium sp. BK399]MCS3742750.1 hypothetical protein [Rhizobium sp. BK661]MCS4096376.1 hypothetical protein [Rhizobium sp. BK176]